jgi:soluble lytic murein transglycosylase-like protein
MINGAVAFFGGSSVFPLSPYFLGDKARALGSYALHRSRCLFRGHPPLGPLVAQAEARHRIPPGLLAAVIDIESASRVHRISAAGAMGPGQLMPATARLLGVSDPFHPEANVDASARYLASHLARFRNVRFALAAYNAGPGAVRGRVPRNGQTEYYVDKVMRAYAARGRPRERATPPSIWSRKISNDSSPE